MTQTMYNGHQINNNDYLKNIDGDKNHYIMKMLLIYYYIQVTTPVITLTLHFTCWIYIKNWTENNSYAND